MTSISQRLSRPQKLTLILGVGLLTVGVILLMAAGWIEGGDFTAKRKLLGLVIRDAGSVSIVLGIVTGVSIFFRHLPAARWMYSKLFVPITLVCVSTIVALVFVELALYIMYKDIQIGGQHSPSGYTFYKKYYQRNSWGFRDVERDVVKEPGTFRILTLGDSFTFGAGVKFKESLYTALLEKRLNLLPRTNMTFEVINSGLKGLSTADELMYLQETGLSLAPDLVLVGHVINDVETEDSQREFQKGTVDSTLLPARYHRLFSYYSFTYYLTRKAFRRFLQGDAQRYSVYLADLYSGSNLREYEEVMVDLTQTSEDRNIPVVWVSFPELRVSREEQYPFSYVSDALLGIAARNEMRLIELRDAIVASDETEFTVSEWDGHPNEVVQQIAADEIFDRLVSDRLIPGVENAGAVD